MNKYIGILLVFFLNLSLVCKSQDTIVQLKLDTISVGMGIGIDHGGIGYNLMYYPSEQLGLFAGIGYAIAGIGLNAGGKLRIINEDKISKSNFFFTAMYGYNAGVKVKRAEKYDKLFYGITLGGGFDTHPKAGRNSYWSFSILVPFRNPDLNEYINDLEQNQNVVFEIKPFPFLISISNKIILK